MLWLQQQQWLRPLGRRACKWAPLWTPQVFYPPPLLRWRSRCPHLALLAWALAALAAMLPPQWAPLWAACWARWRWAQPCSAPTGCWRAGERACAAPGRSPQARALLLLPRLRRRRTGWRCRCAAQSQQQLQPPEKGKRVGWPWVQNSAPAASSKQGCFYACSAGYSRLRVPHAFNALVSFCQPPGGFFQTHRLV